MSFDPGLSPGQIIDNQELTDIFKCSTQGGMRRSKATNTLVLVSNHTKSLYEDVWKGGLFHYTGMGTLGDQSLNFMQNKTLVKSVTNGVGLFVFEVFTTKSYTYIGQADLAAEPYQELQADDQGQIRKVWMFPLKIRGGRPPAPVPEEALAKQQARRERTVKKLNDQELHERARLARRIPGQRTTVTKSYQRDPNVVMWVRRVAKGKCQLCGQPAPFFDKHGEPYLECHYIEWLSEGGEDSIENAVALCPNCHRKMHTLNLAEDLQTLKQAALQNG